MYEKQATKISTGATGIDHPVSYARVLGTGWGKDNAAQPSAKGLNTTMPGAVLKDEKGLTKMSFYDEAALDSVKQKDREKNDPFFAKPPSLGDLSSLTKSTGVNYSDPNEAKVYEKLAQLNAVMHQPEPIPPGASTAAPNDPNIDRLQ